MIVISIDHGCIQSHFLAIYLHVRCVKDASHIPKSLWTCHTGGKRAQTRRGQGGKAKMWQLGKNNFMKLCVFANTGFDGLAGHSDNGYTGCDIYALKTCSLRLQSVVPPYPSSTCSLYNKGLKTRAWRRNRIPRRRGGKSRRDPISIGSRSAWWEYDLSLVILSLSSLPTPLFS